jgi:hypothetical protein
MEASATVVTEWRKSLIKSFERSLLYDPPAFNRTRAVKETNLELLAAGAGLTPGGRAGTRVDACYDTWDRGGR